jgi:hypothetical protein
VERGLIDCDAWLDGAYRPTPTIIEAARALYSGHEVRELSQSHASAEHLERTFRAVERVMRTSEEERSKAVCFVTGVPRSRQDAGGLERRTPTRPGRSCDVPVGQRSLGLRSPERPGERPTAARGVLLVRSQTEGLDTRYESPSLAGRVPSIGARTTFRSNALSSLTRPSVLGNGAQSKRKFGRDRSEPEMMLSTAGSRAGRSAPGGAGRRRPGDQHRRGGLSRVGPSASQQLSLTGRSQFRPSFSRDTRPSRASTLFPNGAQSRALRVETDPHLHLAVTQRSFRAQQLTEWGRARARLPVARGLPHDGVPLRLPHRHDP